MRKAIVALTALAFMINFAVPVMAANTGTTSGKNLMTKPLVNPLLGPTDKTPNGTVTSKKQYGTSMRRQHREMRMQKAYKADMRGKGPYLSGHKTTKMGAKYHKHGVSSKTYHKRMGMGPKGYQKHMKRSSGKICPPMPGQTY